MEARAGSPRGETLSAVRQVREMTKGDSLLRRKSVHSSPLENRSPLRKYVSIEEQPLPSSLPLHPIEDPKLSYEKSRTRSNSAGGQLMRSESSC